MIMISGFLTNLIIIAIIVIFIVVAFLPLPFQYFISLGCLWPLIPTVHIDELSPYLIVKVIIIVMVMIFIIAMVIFTVIIVRWSLASH